MKYYDYYDFSDEMRIVLRLYKEGKPECDKLKDEIKQIENENVKLKRRGSVLGQTAEDEIKRRKIQRSIDFNKNNIKEKESKIKSIMKPVNEAIKKAEKKFVDKIEEKNEKIKDSETNVKVVEQQLEKCRTQIKEIEEKHELTEALKLAMLRGLKEQEDEYVNLYEEFCKKSENLLEEKNEVIAMKEALDRSEFEKLEVQCDLIEEQIRKEHSTVQQTVETPQQEEMEGRTDETARQQVVETPEREAQEQRTAGTARQQVAFKNIQYIEISEKRGIIFYKDEQGQETSLDIKETLKSKKDKYKKLGIKAICEEMAGGMISGSLLKRKINPEIVAVLSENPIQLKQYIQCIKDKQNLPFELIHDFRETGLISKIRKNKIAKIEKSLGAKVFGKLWDKNEAIEENEQPTITDGNANRRSIDHIQVENGDNHIESQAIDNILKDEEQRRARNVENMIGR